MDPTCLHKVYKIIKDYEKRSLTKTGRIRKGFERTDWILEYLERQLLKL